MTGRSVLLVGSIGLDSVAEVLETAGTVLGDHLTRMPDGEPGGRRMWINWQFPLLRSTSFLLPDRNAEPSATGVLPLRLIEGTPARDIHFGELGYAREARASYEDFRAARARGHFSAKTRFQVCLPTPYAVVGTLVRTPDAEAVQPAYEQAMLREIAAICAAIPPEDLCIQWDICPEMIALDGRSFIRPFAGMERYFAERFARLAAAVPVEAELGYHLCYGDLDGKHYVEPENTAKMRDMMHLIAGAAGRPVTYFHLPVPIGRTDPAYFAPLADLRISAETELFLGLVHAQDGIEGTRKRIEAARTHIETFGIAAECGLSRARTVDFVTESLRLHALAAGSASVDPPINRK